MNDFVQTGRRLAALTEVASGRKVTHRSLAAQLGISLGLANGLIRRLQEERLVKAEEAGEDKMSRYALTASGRAAMRRLGAEFASGTAAWLGAFREELHRGAAALAAGRVRRVALFGNGPLADMAASALASAGVKIVVVKCAEPCSLKVAGFPCRTVGRQDAPGAELVVCACESEAREARKRLGARARIVALAPGAPEGRRGA